MGGSFLTGRSSVRLAVFALLSVAVLGWWASKAGAAIYWNQGDAIGRANLDGSNPEPEFIPFSQSLERYLCAGTVAVDASHIYWSDPINHRIGRANLDGTEVNYSFVAGLGPVLYPEEQTPCGLAVDGSHVFWTDGPRESIGRAKLDGSEVEQEFVSADTWIDNVKVVGPYLYWIGVDKWLNRADLDGTHVLAPLIDYSGEGRRGFAIVGSRVYWGNYLGFDYGSIGRVNLDGSAPEPGFLGGLNPAPGDIAVFGSKLFWSEGEGISRSNLDGSGVEKKIVSGIEAGGIAVDDRHVDPRPLPSSQLAFAKVKHGKGGLVTLLALDAGEPGGSYSMRVRRGVGWNPIGGSFGAADQLHPGRSWFAIYPNESRAGRRLARSIHSRGRVMVRVTLSYTAKGQATTVRSKQITLSRGPSRLGPRASSR